MASEIIDLGVEHDIIKKSGSWFSYNDTKIAQGRDAAKRVIDDNPELADELEALIMAALNEGKPKKGGKKTKSDASASKNEERKSEDVNDDVDVDIDDINFDDDEFSIEEDA